MPLGDDGAWAGGAVTERAVCVLAAEPRPDDPRRHQHLGARRAGSSTAVVLDPGPADDRPPRGHRDGRRRPARRAGPAHPRASRPRRGRGAVRGARAVHRWPRSTRRTGSATQGLVDGDRLEVGGVVLDVVATPGHTADSLSFHLVADGALLTGDTVLGRGTTVVAHPGRPPGRLPRTRCVGSRVSPRRAGRVRPARTRPGARRPGRVRWRPTSSTGRHGSRRCATALEAGAVTADDVRRDGVRRRAARRSGRRPPSRCGRPARLPGRATDAWPTCAAD